MPSNLKPFQLGNAQIYPDRNLIVSNSIRHQLPEKTFNILLVLIEGKGNSVSRNHLMDKVWGQHLGSDELLNNSISKLRKALGISKSEKQIIETVPKFGYRLSVFPQSISKLKTNNRNKLFILSVFIIFVAILAFTFSTSTNTLTTHQNYSLYDFTLRDIINLQGIEYSPTYNADGSKIIFSQIPKGHTYSDVYLQDLNSGDIKQLTFNNKNETLLSWNHRHKNLALVEETDTSCWIKMLNPATLIAKNIFDCHASRPYSLSWTPSGDYLISSWVDPESKTFGNYQIDLISQSASLMPETMGSSNVLASYSASGEFLAWINLLSIGQDEEIAILDIANNTIRKVHTQLDIRSLEWSQNDNKLYIVTHTKLEQYKLSALLLNNKDINIVEMLEIDGFNSDMDIHPITGNIIFSQYSIRKQLLKINMETQQISPEIESSYRDDNPNISQSGHALIFRSNRSGKQGIWIRRYLANQSQLLFDTDSNIYGLDWLGDDKTIIYTKFEHKQYRQYIYDITENKHSLIDELVGQQFYPVVGQNPHLIYFTKLTEQGCDTVIYNRLESSLEVVLKNACSLKESPDTKWYYYNIPKKAGIWRKSVTTGKVELFIDNLNEKDFANWTVIDQGIIYLDQSDKKVIIRSINWQGNEIWQPIKIDLYLLRMGTNFTFNQKSNELIVVTDDSYQGSIKLISFKK